MVWVVEAVGQAAIPVAVQAVIPAVVRAVVEALAVAVREAAERRGSGKWRVGLTCARQWRDGEGSFGGFISLLDKLFIKDYVSF